ncbi:MAG: transporter substrate-binding domain-containing protein [Burkholderiales bacterium]|nr:transporter substrate-binding domain-containing protein [Burkholderiales bacterium]
MQHVSPSGNCQSMPTNSPLNPPERVRAPVRTAIGCILFAALFCLFAKAEPTAHRTWQVGVVIDPPYVQVAPHGGLTGASVELLNQLAVQSGHAADFVLFDSIEARDAAARTGRIDIAPLLPQTAKDLHTWRFSEPVLRVPVKLVAHPGFPVGSLDELFGQRVAVRTDSPQARFLAENYPALPQTGTTTEKLALDAVSTGRADVALIDQPRARALLGRGDYVDLDVIGDAGYTQALRIASRADDPALGEALDAAIGRFPNERLADLQRRWLSVITPPFWRTLLFWREMTLLASTLALAAAGAWLWQRHLGRGARQALDAASAERTRRAEDLNALRLTQASLDRSTVGVIWLHWDGRIRYLNQAAATLYGYSTMAMLGQRFSIVDPSLVDRHRWLAHWQQSDQPGGLVYETHHQRADGSPLDVELRLSRLRFEDSDSLIALVSDITERQEARGALLMREASLRELAAHLETVREEEKARLAREVHDELGQVLTGVKLETASCELAFGDREPALRERLATIKQLLDQTFPLVRNLAAGLRPPVLDTGLAAALDWLAHEFEKRYRLPCAFTRSAHLPSLPEKISLALFRIAQEALTNVARHAHAESVRLDLSVIDNTLFLSIEDDGQGFEAATLGGGTFGLLGMRERAWSIGADLAVDTQPGEGCEITVRLVLQTKETT